MRYIFSASVLAIVMILGQGCNNTRNAYIQPAVETEMEPVSIGIGALKYKNSCDNGFARVEYVFEEDRGIDPLSFVFQHSIDGDSFDIDDGSSNSNGSLVTVRDNVFIPENDTFHIKVHTVSVTYLNDGVYVLDEFSFLQKTCENADVNVTKDTDENVTVYGSPRCSTCS